MRVVLIVLMFGLQASTLQALDTLRTTNVLLSLPWLSPVIGANEDPSGLVTTIIAQNGCTWSYPHGMSSTTTVYPEVVNERLDEAVAVRNTFVYASTGSTLIKYAWPGMKELERLTLDTTIDMLSLWTHDRVALLAGERVWAFRVDEPLASGSVLLSDGIVSIASSDSSLYMAKWSGMVYCAKGDSVKPFFDFDRSISHIAASSNFIAVNQPDAYRVMVYSLMSGNTESFFPGTPGRSIAWCSDSVLTSMVGNGSSFRFKTFTLDSYSGEMISYWEHSYMPYEWTADSRVLSLSNDLFMYANLNLGASRIYHVRTRNDFAYEQYFDPQQAFTRISDNTIAVATVGRSPEFKLEFDDGSMYSNIITFDASTGLATASKRSPIAVEDVVDLKQLGSQFFATQIKKSQYETWRVGPKDSDIFNYGRYKQLLTRDSLAWMMHWQSSSKLDSTTFSEDHGRSWNRVMMPNFSTYTFYRSAYQVGANARLYGPHYYWKNIHYFEANNETMWFTEPLLSPEDGLTPRYTLPMRDHAVLCILDYGTSTDRPSRIWELDYTAGTANASLLYVPDHGQARVVAAAIYDKVMMGSWESIDTRSIGAFITDGESWKFYSIDTGSMQESALASLVALNDTTLVIYSDITNEFFVAHPSLDQTVSVSTDHYMLADESHSTSSIVSADGAVRWEHGLSDAVIDVFDIHGRRSGQHTSTSGYSEVTLPGTGIYVLQATSGTRIRRLIVAY